MIPRSFATSPNYVLVSNAHSVHSVTDSWSTETERAQWILSVQSREAWLADFSSGVRWAVPCLDDGRQHFACHPRLHPHLHGVPDHSVQNLALISAFVEYAVRSKC